MLIKISLEEYAESFSPGSRPHMSTLRKRCQAGYYPNAIKEGRQWYLVKNLSTGDARADEILKKYGTT